MIRRPPRSTLFPYTNALPILLVGPRDVAPPGAGLGAPALDELLEPLGVGRSEEHTSELQSRQYLVCRLLLEKKKNKLKRQQRIKDRRHSKEIYYRHI